MSIEWLGSSDLSDPDNVWHGRFDVENRASWIRRFTIYGSSYSNDEKKPLSVDWDGPSDPTNPKNWSNARRWSQICILGLIVLQTPLASSIFSPALDQIMSDFNTKSPVLVDLSLSAYVLGFAIGPLIVAPLSEVYGRLYIYHICNILFVINNVACAISPTIWVLILFRFLSGCAGSCPLTLGGGTIADIMEPEKRGRAMSVVAFGSVGGPILGPVSGGIIAERVGWRWVFGMLVCFGALTTATALIFMRETYAPRILELKARRKARLTGDSGTVCTSSSNATLPERLRRAATRPLRLLLLSPIVLILSLLSALTYGLQILLYISLPSVYKSRYGFTTAQSGLAFLGVGTGMVIGLLAFGIISDKVLMILAKRNGGEKKPEYRLPVMLWGSLLLPAGLLGFGWGAEGGVGWGVPMVGNVVAGVGIYSVSIPVQMYLVDWAPQYAATMSASTSILRSLVGAFLPLSKDGLTTSLGLGWGITVLAGISLATWPATFILYTRGERIRDRFPIEM